MEYLCVVIQISRMKVKNSKNMDCFEVTDFKETCRG